MAGPVRTSKERRKKPMRKKENGESNGEKREIKRRRERSIIGTLLSKLEKWKREWF